MAAVLYLPNRDGVGAAEVNANSYPERDSILFGVSTIGSDDGIVLWTIEFENEPPAKRQSRRITKPPPHQTKYKTGTTDTRGRRKCNGFSLVVESAGLKANPIGFLFLLRLKDEEDGALVPPLSVFFLLLPVWTQNASDPFDVISAKKFEK
jgi:hypothetical protein